MDTTHATIMEASQAVTEMPISSDLHMHQQSDDKSAPQATKLTEQAGMKIGDNLEHRDTSLPALSTAKTHSSLSFIGTNVLIGDREGEAVADEDRGDNIQCIKAVASTVNQAAVTDACQFNTSIVTRGPEFVELEPYDPAAADHQQKDVSSGDYSGESNEIFSGLLPGHRSEVVGVTAAKRGVTTISYMTMDPMPMTHPHTDYHEVADPASHLQALDDTVVERGASTIDVMFTEPATEPRLTDTTGHHAEPSLSGEVKTDAKKDVTQDLHVHVRDAGNVAVTGRSATTFDDVTIKPFRPDGPRNQEREYPYREFSRTCVFRPTLLYFC